MAGRGKGGKAKVTATSTFPFALPPAPVVSGPAVLAHVPSPIALPVACRAEEGKWKRHHPWEADTFGLMRYSDVAVFVGGLKGCQADMPRQSQFADKDKCGDYGYRPRTKG